MKEVTDERQVKAASTWVAETLDGRHDFLDGVAASRGWTVVPVESGLHFDAEDCGRIAMAAVQSGKHSLRAILLEEAKGMAPLLAFPSSKEGLLAFNRRCAHFNYAIVPDDYSFAIVCTTDDYYLVAGPKDFVRMATGRTIEEARAEFQAFAGQDESWLGRVANRYSS